MAHNSIQGPAIFLAQFAGDVAPFNTLPNIAHQCVAACRLAISTNHSDIG